MLAACLAGAAEMFLVVFLYLLGSALFDLRARTAAPEVMAVGLSLLGLAFSHPIGAAVDVAVVPLLLFAVRPTLIANSAFNVILALVFPTVFALGAFAYVSWVFPGSGWSFLAAPAESLAGWAADAPRVFSVLPGSLAINAAIALAAALALGAPIAPVVIGWIRERRPLAVPPLVFAGAIVGASAITVATGFFGSPAPLVAAAPILAAVIVGAGAVGGRTPAHRAGAARRRMVRRHPRRRHRRAARRRATPRRVRRQHHRAGAAGSLALGGMTLNRDGVLIDTDNAPAVVLGRGQAHGLVAPSDPDFTLALLFGRLNSPFVAVPDPHAAMGIRDRLNKAFPLLYRDGAPGYRLAYQNKTWRLYARQPATGK